jgi:tetratricopeptide (TPR) repeat protein
VVGNIHLIYNFYQGEFLLKQNNEVYNYLASYIEVAYNDFLQIAIEMGMFGVLFITSSLVLIFKNIKTYDDKTIEGIIVMAIIGFFSFPFQTSSTVALCCIYFASISSQHKPLLEINLRDRILKGLILLPSIWFMFLLFEIQNSLFIWKLSKQNIAILNQEKFVKTVEVLSNDKNFLVWYADILYLQKKHIQSIAILKRASTLSSKLDIFLLLALNYEAMGKMVASEQNYKKCILLVPSLIKPKFFLMKMYLQNKRLREAKKLALSIINTKLKINNNEADYMIKMSKKVIELN